MFVKSASVKAVLAVSFFVLAAGQAHAASFTPDKEYLRDRELLDKVQRDTFNYMWEDGDPVSGMVYEASFPWEVRPVTAGGTGFGIAAIVAATDRGWITREQAVNRMLKIVRYLRDKTPRKELHGAFPHWINTTTGAIWDFSANDGGADLVETSFLMQGLLIARGYFNGPGVEEELRGIITDLWEGVDWNWFTNGEENGLYWQWDKRVGFNPALKILGYNECLVTYALAISSPTHPISRRSYDYWMSGDKYQPADAYGYRIEACPPGGGPLFIAQYSFVGLDPRRIADAYVKEGYFVRGTKQTLSNRGYCLWEAPAANRYAEGFWGLTASQIKGGYGVGQPTDDNATVAPTAALSSFPYTPHYSMQVLRNFGGGLRKRICGRFGPYDAISLRDDWTSDLYLAIDQLPIACMIENFRSGLLWQLFMADPDVRAGLEKAGLVEPDLPAGFPEAVVTVRKEEGKYVPDAYDIRRHPDTGQYLIPYRCGQAGEVAFSIVDADGEALFSKKATAAKGANILFFPQFAPVDGKVLSLIMTDGRNQYNLPVRLH